MTAAPRIVAIVNADDLGMSREVNDAIFGLMADNKLFSATILVNGPEAADAAARLRHFPRCSFGVHLNLTQFAPLTGAAAHRLVDESGVMSRRNETARPSMALLRAAYAELCAQVERLAALGVPISHFDSHNHVHTRPQLFPVLKAVQRRFGIRRVRLSKNVYAADQAYPAALQWKKRSYNAALRTIYRTNTTDAFTELSTYTRLAPEIRSHFGRIELMVHPGASYAAGETSILQSDWLTREVPGLRLASYAELA